MVGTSPVGSSPTEVLGLILAKKDHIEGLGPVPLMGLGPVWLIPVLLRCVIDPGEEISFS